LSYSTSPRKCLILIIKVKNLVNLQNVNKKKQKKKAEQTTVTCRIKSHFLKHFSFSASFALIAGLSDNTWVI
jgi:hypothetical protein